jgi:hypothetical protein
MLIRIRVWGIVREVRRRLMCLGLRLIRGDLRKIKIGLRECDKQDRMGLG